MSKRKSLTFIPWHSKYSCHEGNMSQSKVTKTAILHEKMQQKHKTGSGKRPIPTEWKLKGFLVNTDCILHMTKICIFKK